MSLKINEVLDVLKAAKVPDATLRVVAEQLKQKEDLKKDNQADPSDKAKKQFVLLQHSASKEAGFALQVEESQDTAKTVDLIKNAMTAYNKSKKGVKFPVKTVEEALQNLPRKFLVAEKVWVKTKEPVVLLS